MAEVLVVDDDNVVRQLVTDVLELEGHQVVGMPDGPSALAYLRSMRPDCVVLDVMLPRLDGFEVLAKIREQPGLNDLPVALLTAAGDDATVWRGWQSGASWFFTKPLDTDKLRDFVSALEPGRVRQPAPTTSPYELATAHGAGGTASEDTLLEIMHSLESQALLHGRGQLVFLSLPGPAVLRNARMSRLEQLAAQGNDVIIMGRKIPRRIGAADAASLVPLRHDDRLQRELVHVVASPSSGSVLVARTADTETHWSFSLSHDPDLVDRVATVLLERVPHLHLSLPQRVTAAPTGDEPA